MTYFKSLLKDGPHSSVNINGTLILPSSQLISLLGLPYPYLIVYHIPAISPVNSFPSSYFFPSPRLLTCFRAILNQKGPQLICMEYICRRIKFS